MDYYFFNDGSGDTDWSNSNNWWTDAAHTIPNGSPPSPSPGDVVYVDSVIDMGIPDMVTWDMTLNANSTFSTNTINSGTVTNNSNCVIQEFTNTGNVINTNNLSINSTGVLNSNYWLNSGTMTLNNSFDNDGIFINDGTVDHNGFTFTNDGPLTNNGTINIGGIFECISSLTNNGTIISSNSLHIQSTFINNGTLSIMGASRFSMSPNTTLTNNGNFIFGSLYSTGVKGRIFPQIPSSRAFGGAILGNIF